MSFRFYKRLAPGVGVSGGPLEMLALDLFQGISNGIGATVARIFQAAPRTRHSGRSYDMETSRPPTFRQRQAEQKELAHSRLQELRNGGNPYADLYWYDDTSSSR